MAHGKKERERRERERILAVFRKAAPEFSDVADAEVCEWADLARPYISRKRFGKFYEEALALLAAHRMKLSGLGDNTSGSIGDIMRVSSYSEGEVSVSYGVSNNLSGSADAEYTLTVYGLQFLNIRRLCVVPIRCAAERRTG